MAQESTLTIWIGHNRTEKQQKRFKIVTKLAIAFKEAEKLIKTRVKVQRNLYF